MVSAIDFNQTECRPITDAVSDAHIVYLSVVLSIPSHYQISAIGTDLGLPRPLYLILAITYRAPTVRQVAEYRTIYCVADAIPTSGNRRKYNQGHYSKGRLIGTPIWRMGFRQYLLPHLARRRVVELQPDGGGEDAGQLLYGPLAVFLDGLDRLRLVEQVYQALGDVEDVAVDVLGFI